MDGWVGGWMGGCMDGWMVDGWIGNLGSAAQMGRPTWGVKLGYDPNASVLGICNDVAHIPPAVDVPFGEAALPCQLW